MEELHSDVPARLIHSIRIELRRIHAKFLDNPDRRINIAAAFDVYASSLMNNGEVLTADILQNRIPAWVIHWAILKEWISYPEFRQTDNTFITPRGEALARPTFSPIPENERPVVIESYRITKSLHDHLVRHMKGRMVHWETEASLVQPLLEIPEGSRNDCKRKEAVQAFLARCNAISPERIYKRHIWKSVGHTKARQFERWQSCADKATEADTRNFGRILRMTPENFMEALKKKNLVGPAR